MGPTLRTALLLTAVFGLGLGGLALAAARAVLARGLPGWPLPDTAMLMGALPWIVGGGQAAVVAAFLADAVLAARALRPDRLRVRRERPAHLSVGIANDVTLVVENTGRRPMRLLLRDEPPEDFPAEPPVLEAAVPGRRQVRHAYQLIPAARGQFRFGDVQVRGFGPLGLAWVDRTVPAAEPAQVYPNLLEVRRYEALVRTTLVRSGGYRVQRLPGAGREFSNYRDYNPDDDYRDVSWTATARRGRPITAVRESELSQDIFFCLDVGRMMAARVGRLTKLDHAINAVLMLTHVSQAFQDNVGLLVFSHEVQVYLPPAKGKAQHARFLQALYTVRPELSYVNYQEAFRYLIARHPKRALTLVFTDLLDGVVSAEYRDAARLLRRFHLPLTLAVADVPLQELAARTPATREETYDVLVARDLLQARSELLGGLEREGVPVVDTVPERLTVDAVNRYLALKTGMRL